MEIQYFSCTNINKEKIYKVFTKGFSDYVVKVEMSQTDFFTHFFGAEGNDLFYSHIAMLGDEPIGLVLGGIRQYEGLRTMRCGTMCVIPNYRNKGIAQELLKLHFQTAKEQQCEQMFLECIVTNEKAINFYKKNGYNQSYNLYYYTLLKENYFTCQNIHKITMITKDELSELRESLNLHINWQNEAEYISKSDVEILGIKDKSKLIAAIAFKENRIKFLYVQKEWRSRSCGKQLITHVLKGNNESISVSFPSNVSIEAYYCHLGFKKNELSQFEMYKSIN